MNSFLGDIRCGTRVLLKRPGLSALAIVALAVGIGLTTTMFSIVYAAVLKGLPYEQSDRLVAIFRNRPAQGIQFMQVSIHDFMDWREQQKSFEALAAFYVETVNVSGSEGRPIRFDAKPIAGRTFSDADREGSLPVAIVNPRFVKRFFGGSDPLGRRIRLGDDAAPWRTIVGVVPDLHLGGAFAQLEVHDEGVYLPLAQNAINFVSLIVRTERDPMTYASAIQSEVNKIDPALPLYWVRSLEQQYELDTWFFRAFGTLFMVFGFAALALAVVGLYGMMSFSVTQRTREIGVRMALGAQARRILELVLGQGGLQLGIGVLLGVGFAAILSRALQAMLFGVNPWDPVVFALVIATLSVSGVAACLIPAVRATRLDPIDALRYE